MGFLDRKVPRAEAGPADLDAAQLADEAVPAIDRAKGADWYAAYANDADRAVVALCRLRRARAGQRAGAAEGDDAVRAALEQADPQAVVWLASRAISYLDEQGYPETMAPWLDA